MTALLIIIVVDPEGLSVTLNILIYNWREQNADSQLRDLVGHLQIPLRCLCM